jgi:DNA-directed RNA polymerase specialized sigma24 family protein
MRDPRFEKFVAVQAGPLLRLAYLLTHDHRDAEDLVQEVLLAALRKWDTVEAADRPDAYIRRMIVNNPHHQPTPTDEPRGSVRPRPRLRR